MKKALNKVLIVNSAIILLYILIYILLKQMNLTYTPLIKQIFLIFVIFEIIIACKCIIKNRNNIFVIFVIVGIIGVIAVFSLSDKEEYVYYEGVRVIKVTHSSFKSNWVAYYEYENFFLRKNSTRAIESYDDGINENEYAGITYYDNDGNEVEDFAGTSYIDLAELKQFDTGYNNTTDIETLEELLNEIQENYSDNYSKITNDNGALILKFSLNKNKIITNIEDIERIDEIIKNYINKEKNKELAIYYNIIISDTGKVIIRNTSENIEETGDIIEVSY